jgi:RimJ/RimL family protein N-acetyltransferase
MDAPPYIPETLVTSRLVLRRARADDGPALGRALAETLDELVPWFRWADSLKRWGSAEDLAVRAHVAEKRYQLGCDPTYFLWDRDEPERLIGEIALKTEGWRFKVLTYTVWVRKTAFGQGFASEGSRALLDAAFRRADADFVEAECAYRNFRSRRLLTRLGFERFGSTHDHERYVLQPVSGAR